MPGKKLTVLVAGFVILLGALALPSLAAAQTRVNDKDMDALIRNLKGDAKSFQPVFNAAVKRSLIRKTSREKDARTLVSSFVKQTSGLLDTFRRTKKADDALPVVLSTATQIDKQVYDLNLDRQATDRWEKIKAELQQLSKAAGVQDPLGSPASPQASSPPEEHLQRRS